MLLVYLIIVNALGFLLMRSDKQRAKKKMWRISESALLGTALIGGSIGVLLGMEIFRHKTKKPRFYAGIPLIMMIQILLIMLKLGA